MGSRNLNLLGSEERGRRNVSFILSLPHPNNGFENISIFLFVPLVLTTKKIIVR
jgi:hypothetical protein